MINLNILEFSRTVAASLMWAPSIYQAHANAPMKLKFDSISKVLNNYIGPFGVKDSTEQVQCLVTKACYQKFTKSACIGQNTQEPGQVGNDDKVVSMQLVVIVIFSFKFSGLT